jgi:light-regulated signal transduction histidine kinase (bacteriophytochrome)
MRSGADKAAGPGWLGDPEAVREFLTIAVHDLREPLRTIRSSSEFLAEIHKGSTDENEARYVRFISDGIDRMENLIRDIAELCYDELREFQPAEADLQTVLAEVRHQLSKDLQRSDAVLTHDPLPVVTGDVSGLAAVFRCLIQNACKFRGATAPRIHVAAIQRESEWLISVRDNGLGFNPVYRDQIFKPFERLNGKRYPGSGLGLALAKRILEQHGGRIWADSLPEQGSTFWFTLPADPGTSASV